MVPISYSIRSLAQRKSTTAAAAFGVAAVVAVFSGVLMLANSIERTLGRSGAEDVAIVLRDGADAELSSGIEVAQVAIIEAAPQVRSRGQGTPDSTGEVVAVLAVAKADGSGLSNMTIRGVPDDVFDFRSTARIVAGREARPGADEVVVGSAIAGRFVGVGLDETFELRRNRPVRVVGIFEDEGSSYESEVWSDLETAQDAFGRQGLVSSVRVRLRSAGDFDAYKDEIESNRQLGLQVLRETEYYEDQSEGTSAFITALGLVIAVLASFGAMIGAMITMYAAVANRAKEIGTLRALGFRRFQILTAFLIESMALSLFGGLLGVAASLALGFVKFSVVNFNSWSEVVFSFEPTPMILGVSLVTAAAMGVLGGFLPAVRAARTPILDALRGA
jgi:putative ABC transport system permease protein